MLVPSITAPRARGSHGPDANGAPAPTSCLRTSVPESATRTCFAGGKGLAGEGASLTPDPSEGLLADTPATPAGASVATDVAVGARARPGVRGAVAGLVGPALVTHTAATGAVALASAHPVRCERQRSISHIKHIKVTPC